MALAFRCSSHNDCKISSFTRDRERREESEKLATAYPPANAPGEQPVIPKPEIFDALHLPTADLAALPTTAECAVHLQLLEKFVALKQKILTSNDLDRALAIVPKDKLVVQGGKRQRRADETFKAQQAVKWPIFVRIAAARFLKWWGSCSPILHAQDDKLRMTEISLPPLDVLMVWHAFLLSPIKYETFCKASGKEEMLKLQFPWLIIHRSLVDNDPSVKLGTQATDLFNKDVGEVGLFDTLACYHNHAESFRVSLQSLVRTDGKSRLSVEFPGLRGTPLSDNGWRMVDVFGALTERHAAFAERMTNVLWLRSPAVGGTLSRALVRYERLMALFRKHPRRPPFVPTLDIDLVWYTQQCSPTSYLACCTKLTGRAIHHDDTLEGEARKKAYAETSRLYELEFQDEYNACLCWHCEAIKSQLEGHEPMEGIDFAAIVQKVQDEVMYYKAVELARRKGKPLPALQNDHSN